MGTPVVDGRSHREAAESVATGWEPERRRDPRWQEPVRWTRRWWRRRGAGARARAWNGTECGTGGFSKSAGAWGRMREGNGGGGSAGACHEEERKRERESGPRCDS
jgi:hypothetical protein